MDIKEYSSNMKKAVEKRLGKGYRVDEATVDKINGVSMEALVIHKEKINLAPTIYLKPYYEDYLNGEGIREGSERIVQVFYRAVPGDDLDMKFYVDYETVKKGLYYKLISTERNTALLNTIPHVPFLDLDIVFYYSLETDGLPEGSILVKNSHMEMWGVNTETLMMDARMNSPLSMPVKCREMKDVLMELKPDAFDMTDELNNMPAMYVISNCRMVNGASTILYPGILTELSDRLKGNLYIIPSSVHEVIVIPDDGRETSESLRSMIYSINRTQLDPQEVLSDSLYYYDRETEKITIAS